MTSDSDRLTQRSQGDADDLMPVSTSQWAEVSYISGSGTLKAWEREEGGSSLALPGGGASWKAASLYSTTAVCMEYRHRLCIKDAARTSFAI